MWFCIGPFQNDLFFLSKLMGALFCIYLSVYYMDSYTAMVPSFQHYIENHF